MKRFVKVERMVRMIVILILVCILFLLVNRSLRAQVLVSMDIMTTAGTAPQVGKGVAAYTVNIHVTGVGASPVPFTLVRQNFPEIRLYSLEQGNDILATRIAQSLPVRLSKYLGYGVASVGIGVTVEQHLSKSPSWLGSGLTVAGLAVPTIDAILSKDKPNYKISNPPPDIISLAPNQGAEYTWLCAKGTAPVTIQVRRINPVLTDPLLPKLSQTSLIKEN